MRLTLLAVGNVTSKARRTPPTTCAEYVASQEDGRDAAAGFVHRRQLWFGSARNVGPGLAWVADDLAITVHGLGSSRVHERALLVGPSKNAHRVGDLTTRGARLRACSDR